MYIHNKYKYYLSEHTKKTTPIGIPFVAQQLPNPTRIHKDAGSIPGFAHWVKDLVLQ